MQIEVVVATYNKPEFLRLVLEGYRRQSDSNFTICIADDGSGSEIADLVSDFRESGLRIRHIWQIDAGFRKNLVLNRAIATSEADYLIFVDNDCIPEPYFVADHRKAAAPGTLIAGRRVNLGAAITHALIANRLSIGALSSRLYLLRAALRRQVRYAELGMHWPWWISLLWSRRARGVIGANMAFWRQDLVHVNGFDNSAVKYGLLEDTDIEWRLHANGVRGRSLLGRGCVFHLDHPTRKSDDISNRQYMEQKMVNGVIFACDGLKEIANHD